MSRICSSLQKLDWASSGACFVFQRLDSVDFDFFLATVGIYFRVRKYFR